VCCSSDYALLAKENGVINNLHFNLTCSVNDFTKDVQENFNNAIKEAELWLKGKHPVKPIFRVIYAPGILPI
jgi:hypothetical protein